MTVHFCLECNVRRIKMPGQAAIELMSGEPSQVWWTEVFVCPSCNNRTTGTLARRAITEYGSSDYGEWAKVLNPIKCWDSPKEKEAWQQSN